MRSRALRSILVGFLSANMVCTPVLLAQPGATLPVQPGGDDFDPNQQHPVPQPPADIDPQVTIPTVLSSVFGLDATSLQQYVITSTSEGPAIFPITVQDSTGTVVASGTMNAMARRDLENFSASLASATEQACTTLGVARPIPEITVFVIAGTISSGTHSKIVNAIGMTFVFGGSVEMTPPLTVFVPFAIQPNASAAFAENTRAATDMEAMGGNARGDEGPCDFATPAYVNASPAEKCLYTKRCAYGRAWADFDLQMAAAMAVAAGATAGCLSALVLSPLCFAGVASAFALTAGVLRLTLARARTRADEDYCKCLVDAGLSCSPDSGSSVH